MIQNVKGEAWTGQDEYFYGKNIAPYTVQCRYNAVHFLKIFAKDTP